MRIRQVRNGELVDVPLTEQVQGETVYHYTNASGLLGILGSGCLWASSPLGLNDLSEMSYGLGVVRDIWSEIYSETQLNNAQIDWLINCLSDDSFARVLGNVYFLSASLISDSLNQWQGYSGTQGYCLGIDTSRYLAIVEREDPPSNEWTWRNTANVALFPGWYRVIYNPVEQKDSAVKVLTFLAEGMPNPDKPEIGSFMASVYSIVGTLIARLKHPAFQDEQEVRYIASVGIGFREQFRVGPTGLVPYIELARGDAPSGYIRDVKDRLPLTMLRCGPINQSERELAKAAAARLLAARGYDVHVVTSDVPYRF